MDSKKAKTCLVITYGPVPTPQYQTIEGGGMRAWGLAKGLKSKGVDVTVAVNASFPQQISEHEDVKLVNWSPDEKFARLINTFDSVIISYCMGSDSVFVANNVNDDVQLILDVYVPIYVEVSARESNVIDDEYTHYMEDIARYNHVLKRGDYFLCASETQKIYYTGVLSGLGIINPRSYREDRIIIAPFGIHDVPSEPKNNPYKKLDVKEDDFLVLWFGGIYPWFQIDEFLGAVKTLSSNPKVKFAIVGGKNPFNPNPDFSKQYEVALRFAKENNLGKSLLFVDWVDFEDRINWYGRADLVISINKPGEENAFSWRTRVMDYVWAELPILTNGGDPLNEQLLSAGAAIRLGSLSKSSLTTAINDLTKDKSATLLKVKGALAKIKSRYYWDNIISPVAKIISEGTTPNSNEALYRRKLGIADPMTENPASMPGQAYNLKYPLVLSKRAISYARRKGLRRSVSLAYRIAKTQFKKKTRQRSDKQYIFISHPIDNTGAPLVLLRMVEEFVDKFGATNVKLVAPGILPHHLKKLKQKGISVDKAALTLGDRLIDLQLGLQKDDFLLMNTLAIYPNYRGYILRALNSGRINHAYWFIHEDTAQIPLVASELSDGKEVTPITRLANKGNLTLVVPSKKVQQDYIELWDTKNVGVLPLNVDVPEKYKKLRPVSDYSRINFLLSGAPADSRKGQLLAISAFYSFIKNHYEKSPDKYRDFTLNLIGIGNDYVSQQIKIVGELLGKRLKLYSSVPYEESLEITSKCSAVICCSLNETFALYVAEGMYMGHILLRNDSAGMEEQLKNGVNGFYLDTKDIKQFVSVIERVLNKKMANEKLQKMGKQSQTLIKPYAHNSYLKILDIK